ncbi:MAG: hypothetical protein ABFS16_08685 [Bacteroidota bacterium]
MKKFLVFVLAAALFAACEKEVEQPVQDDFVLKGAKKEKCTTIQSGTIVDSKGMPITTGYDEWGYNYQAKTFNGFYGNYSRPDEVVTEGDSLQMKWNDAWLSNQDCDGDGKLDRHYGFDSYIGSGAWLTNHMSGTYEDAEGNVCEWDYFVKIVAAPEDAVAEEGIWYAADGTEIGPVIWGSFAIIQEVENDLCAGKEGLQYKSPDHPGLGNW